MPLAHSFSVLSYTEISDHCCISTFIKTNRILGEDPAHCEEVKVKPNSPKIRFDRNRVDRFQENIQASGKLEPLQLRVNTADIERQK